MNPRANILARFRRRRMGVGRFVLVMFIGAAFVAPAGPCFAMAADAGAHASLGHAAHAPGGSNLEHGSHEHSGSQHDRAHGSGLPDLPVKHCPHCPLASMPGHESNAHAFCSESDAASDHGQAQSQTFAPLKLAAVGAFVAVIPISSLLRPPSGAPPDVPSVRPPAIALNVQNCVFLI